MEFTIRSLVFLTLAVALLKVGTFSKDDENVDDDVYGRFRPGTGPSSTET